MIDPDMRERWEKDAAALRAECLRLRQHAFDEVDVTVPCKRCGVPHPLKDKPRVVLATHDLRAILVPTDNEFVVERLTKTLLGEDRWELLGRFGEHSVPGEFGRAIVDLFAKGKRP